MTMTNESQRIRFLMAAGGDRMGRNALDIARAAVSNWRRYHGNESLYNQCQRFDGYYWQWAWAGTDAGIITYESAAAAADASAIYTGNLNSSEVQVGDLAYWHYSRFGHVGSVIGFDYRNGRRTLVTQTGSVGDTIMELGNHVKVSHADTLGLQPRGMARTNGKNRQRVGMSGYHLGGIPLAPEQEIAQSKRDDDMAYVVRVAGKHMFAVSPGQIKHLNRAEADIAPKVFSIADEVHQMNIPQFEALIASLDIPRNVVDPQTAHILDPLTNKRAAGQCWSREKQILSKL